MYVSNYVRLQRGNVGWRFETYQGRLLRLYTCHDSPHCHTPLRSAVIDSSRSKLLGLADGFGQACNFALATLCRRMGVSPSDPKRYRPIDFPYGGLWMCSTTQYVRANYCHHFPPWCKFIMPFCLFQSILVPANNLGMYYVRGVPRALM